MIVPEYWAESRVQHRQDGKQVTIRRFGWSDVSLPEAQALAEVRSKDALRRLLSGEKLDRREPKVAYNGAEGVPIREEIVERHGETVITRNSYGARCLNTANVFFADIDFERQPSFQSGLLVGLTLVMCSAMAGWVTNSRRLGMSLGCLACLASGPLSFLLHRAIRRLRGGDEESVRRRIHAYLAQHPEWSFRVYRTPAGMRLLATHQAILPEDPSVGDCFRALNADPVYALMCKKQQCFRARVSAKPWRIGIPGHMRPRPGIWPVATQHLPMRRAWVERYEAAASSFAACTFLETIGSGVIHPEVKRVQELHDELCRVTSQLPIA